MSGEGCGGRYVGVGVMWRSGGRRGKMWNEVWGMYGVWGKVCCSVRRSWRRYGGVFENVGKL